MLDTYYYPIWIRRIAILLYFSSSVSILLAYTTIPLLFCHNHHQQQRRRVWHNCDIIRHQPTDWIRSRTISELLIELSASSQRQKQYNDEDDFNDVDDYEYDVSDTTEIQSSKRIVASKLQSKSDDGQSKQRRIFLIDDEEAIRKAVGQLLVSRGYQVTTFADGRTALDTMYQFLQAFDNETTINNNNRNNQPLLPDVIVCDIRMPAGMDGIEVLESIRSSSELIDIPVILLTAKGMSQDRITGYNAGADAYIPKPFDPEELITIIENLIIQRDGMQQSIKKRVSNVNIQDLKRDLDEIKYLLLERGGGGVGNGFIEATNVFLTPKERQILELLCEGLMNKEIAQQAVLSVRRIEQILTGLYRKTDTKNRTELVRWAISTGNVQL